jgi:hypothetical protein
MDIGFGGVTVTASCTGGSTLVGGGYTTTGIANFNVFQSSPSTNPLNGTWTVRIDDGNALNTTVQAFALCAQ